MELQSFETDGWLASSWKRSSNAGLKQIKKPDDIHLPRSLLKERRSMSQVVIEAVEQSALPLFNQVLAHSDSRLILTDPDGVILAAWGQDRFREKLLSIALEPGSCWQEKLKGTNAIGTALYEQRAVSIIGDQHFIKQHRFISCSASPLFNSEGKLVGVLDITSEQSRHDVTVQVLVQNMVQLIENHMLTHTPNGAIQINLAHDESVLKSGWQGIVIANEHGEVLAHNQVAAQLIPEVPLLGSSIETLLEHRTEGLYPLVFDQKALGKSKRPKKSLSPSSQLHYGEERIELAWQQANKVIGRDINLLILGETGVGKGEFVKELHKQSNRAKQPLITVNCGALPKDLIESELFGHAPGAFTGASKQGYLGKIRQADKGILFLDEIGEMPLEAQCRLLTVLQEKMVVPVGGVTSHKVDIQIISATHQNLATLVDQGMFREDLYYRLIGLAVTLPPLRERQDKQNIIEAIFAKYRQGIQSISPSLMAELMTYEWKGNLRELDNLLKVTALIASEQEELSVEHIPEHLAQPLMSTAMCKEDTSGTDLNTTLNQTLISAYKVHQGNISKVSRVLGVSRNTVYRKLKVLGLIPTK
ncbi:sigma-54-dependent Fis family transcriptional regulator [Vibrio sp. TBV020]|uniref:sigma-54-dependent Fis family transcriptional regulator n=1 Tax=Vibrio sp. TBV020 TaxID=3137398 RepID=UPI0038CDA731